MFISSLSVYEACLQYVCSLKYVPELVCEVCEVCVTFFSVCIISCFHCNFLTVDISSQIVYVIRSVIGIGHQTLASIGHQNIRRSPHWHITSIGTCIGLSRSPHWYITSIGTCIGLSADLLTGTSQVWACVYSALELSQYIIM